MKIGYQGARGAFSEAAIKLYYEIENIKDADYEAIGYGDFIKMLQDVAENVSDLEEVVDCISDELDCIEEDLDNIDEYLLDEEDEDDEDYEDFEDDEDEDEDEDDEDYDFGETLYEVKCPTCGEVITLDEEMLDEGSTVCPNCGEELEFDEEEDGEEPEE